MKKLKKMSLTGPITLFMCLFIGISQIKANENLDKKTVYFYPSGFNRSVNLVEDTAVLGQNLHLFFMGTDCNFKLEYAGKDDQYYIHTISEKGKLDYLIGESFLLKEDSKKSIVLNSTLSKNEKLNLWNFKKDKNGKYKIQNEKDGNYLSLKQKGKDVDENRVVLSGESEAVEWEIVCYEKEFSDPWMSRINDGKLISEINIPGTHDTATKLVDGLPQQISIAQCQSLTPSEQLNAGVRMFDLRCDFLTSKQLDPTLTHALPTYDKIFDMIYLSEVFKVTEEFLKDNPSETVVFLVNLGQNLLKQGSNEKLSKVMSEYINKNKIWSKNYIPKLGEVRGKIVLLRRFNVPQNGCFGIDSNNFGIDVSDWYSEEDYSKNKGILKLNSGVWVQDHYDCEAAEKLEWFKKSLEQSSHSKIASNKDLVINFSSATKKNPFFCARIMNNEILNSNLIKNGEKCGIIVTDYIDHHLARYIYISNFYDKE